MLWGIVVHVKYTTIEVLRTSNEKYYIDPGLGLLNH